jgi:hypothetical protein
VSGRLRAGARLVLLGCLLAVAPATAATDPVTALLQQANALDLARHPAWLALLHYRPGRLGAGGSSEADAPEFFLAPNGARNPAAELEATLRSLFAPADATGRDGTHPQCSFIARYRWLREALDIDPNLLPEQPCPAFAAWREAIAPVSVTLVFPEAYMNNPSSMFGHTLLRFDTVEAGQRRDLLAYAANFAAVTADDGAVAFAWKGIFGYYPGLFSLMPYYEKVREYGDWEQRDLWEYELDLAPAEIERLLEHLWETRGIRFDYYFFDENCSYRLLRLLEVARPALDLTSRFRTWAIPADTVRAVAVDAGLVRSVAFRPSATTELRHQAGYLTRDERQLAIRLARGKASPTDTAVSALPEERRAAVLTVGHDALRSAYVGGVEQRETSLARARSLLLARSRLAVAGSEIPPAPAPATRPDQGHGTARAVVGGGVRHERPFVEFGARPAFHDLLDPEGGYTAGAQIDFLNVRLRVYADDGEVRLQRLALLDIVSLAPRDDIFRPISWRFDTNVASVLVRDDGDSGIRGLDDRYVWRSHGGGGLARRGPLDGLVYAFAEGTFDVGPGLDQAHGLGLGGETGVFLRPFDDRLALQFSAMARQFVSGEDRTDVRAAATQRVMLNPRNALHLDTAWRHEYGRNWLEAGLAWQHYF